MLEQMLLNKLKQLYPTGLILGDAIGIVGDIGLTVAWGNLDGTIDQKRYKANDKIYLIEIMGYRIKIDIGMSIQPVVHPDLFKGIIYKVKR